MLGLLNGIGCCDLMFISRLIVLVLAYSLDV